ncbi:MAG: proteasome subunit alpha, partial [Nitrospinaceae bacterium]
QTMSGQGKIRALSKLLKENVGMAVQGLGVVSPIFATFDLQTRKPSIHFYDMLGADFQIRTHTSTGSGSPTIRGILEYEDLWGEKPLAERSKSSAITLAIRLLHTAAQFDSATGKARPEDDIFPTVATITDQGYHYMNSEELAGFCKTSLSRG